MISLRTYSLEWLDSLISVTLNPERPYLDNLQPEDIVRLTEKIPEECTQIQSELNNHIFSINKEGQVQHMVKKYHNAIIALRETLAAYKERSVLSKAELYGMQTQLQTSLDSLLLFVEKRYGYYIDPLKHNPPLQKVQAGSEIKFTSKIMCSLSADQIALILRGADEAQVFKARSLNAVFKAIIPYLSTEHKETLSADAVRSKAYNPEEADREAAISALEAIIRKIKSY